MNNEKLPPNDIEAEEAVIGALLIDHQAIYEVSTFLKAQDFYREKNRWAYEACLALYDRSEAINQITVAHELSQKNRLEALGGSAYLSELVAGVPTSVDVKFYAQIVHRLGLMRRLISVGAQISASGYEASSDVDAVLDRAEDLLFGLRHGESHRDFVHIQDVLKQYLQGITPAAPGGDGHIGAVLTGFVELDEILGGGLQRSDMIVLAARPSLGKTSLALNIARNAAVRQKAHVAIFSLEMSRGQLVHRLLSSESGVDSKKVRLALYSQIEEEQIMDAVGALSEAPIYIDDSPMLRVVEMRSKARRLHSDRGIDLIIVDYLQLMRSSEPRANPVQQVTEISQALKALARELEVPVVAVSQLSRAVEQRTPHIPLLSDLRESGSIEQDADVVVFIYREDVYYSKEEWERVNPDKPYPKGVADIIIAKHRNGPLGKISLRFLDRTTRFVNLEIARQ